MNAVPVGSATTANRPRLDRAHLFEFGVPHVLKQSLAATEQDWDDVELELVD